MMFLNFLKKPFKINKKTKVNTFLNVLKWQLRCHNKKNTFYYPINKMISLTSNLVFCVFLSKIQCIVKGGNAIFHNKKLFALLYYNFHTLFQKKFIQKNYL